MTPTSPFLRAAIDHCDAECQAVIDEWGRLKRAGLATDERGKRACARLDELCLKRLVAEASIAEFERGRGGHG